MKLERILLIASALLIGGCASSARDATSVRAPLVPMTDAVGTTTITSALEPEADAETPRVSKPARSLDAASQTALDPKRTASREGKRQLRAEARDWRQTTEIIARFLTANAEELS